MEDMVDFAEWRHLLMERVRKVMGQCCEYRKQPGTLHLPLRGRPEGVHASVPAVRSRAHEWRDRGPCWARRPRNPSASGVLPRAGGLIWGLIWGGAAAGAHPCVWELDEGGRTSLQKCPAQHHQKVELHVQTASYWSCDAQVKSLSS